MSRRRSALALLAALVLSLLAGVFAGSASAGGPTSVLLTVPGTGKTASLYLTDPDYDELAGLVGAFGAYSSSSGEAVKPQGMGDASGVTITWLIHDAQVWRVDRVDLAARGGPMISTQQLTGEGDIWEEPAVEHAATDSKALVALLDRLGLGDEELSAQPSSATPTPESTTPVDSVTARTVDQGWGAGQWPWGLGGMLVGIAMTVTTVQLFRLRSQIEVPEREYVANDLELLDSRGRGK